MMVLDIVMLRQSSDKCSHKLYDSEAHLGMKYAGNPSNNSAPDFFHQGKQSQGQDFQQVTKGC